MSLAVNDEKRELRSDSLVAEDEVHPPSYSVEPPSQEAPEDLSARLASLDLSSVVKNGVNISADQCTAHLKLLEAFNQLREDIGQTQGLFGIKDPKFDSPETTDPYHHAQSPQALAKLRIAEKRWSVYVARAVDRFERWYNACVPATMGGAPCDRLTGNQLLTKKGLDKVAYHGLPIKQLTLPDQVPPLDVLMVWHSYMLNPRCFFEDCFRYGKLDFFATGMPWPAIDPCIDNVTFEFKPSAQAVQNFETATGLCWSNLNDGMEKALSCPRCHSTISVPWTQGSMWTTGDKMAPGNGYADGDFLVNCRACDTKITHEYLRVTKFKDDVEAFTRPSDTPLSGTVLTKDGQPAKHTILGIPPESFFPNALLNAGLADRFMLLLDDPNASMSDVRSIWEQGIADKNLVHKAKGVRRRLLPKERLSIRRMMSRYWFNASPFALDLASAVIRQGSFVEKMHNIDWLHSPALMSTMERLIQKYQRFFTLMAENLHKVAVPTLDIDLAWHTHQLNPLEYYAYSDKMCYGRYIDHDDKIEETALSDAFTWTSKAYADKYGEPYSECTCWYCEAIRESHTSKLDRFFKPNKVQAMEKLHSAELPSDPLNSPHISAHNAVRDLESEANSRVKAAELDKAYHKACAKAKKKGKPEPRRDDYFYYYAWGYPMYMPMYYPYGVPVVGGGGFYPADPCMVNTGAGSYGACAAGSCGGMAAAGGACGGGSGGCGSCGGCGSGGCGSGGGCGGGGGGCGGA
ncbi:hypothetical protein E2P81_ATG04572 [Venturia nashicola]|uniref:Uncharacterized protein n=1 Tax=Venturia nashicola TaxID=86259 RepID=A0A4Z1P970_9PEZI|nr:hypothetical protein E6O75_ATG04681 [Venturia nashicola]TLD34407.1 hypothetical protein E2P81_ATG04572 [Venturia nashicola]